MERESIKKRLMELERLIAETRRRLPAHSAKPPLMMELIELEDEYHTLKREYQGKTPRSEDGTGTRAE